MNKVRDLNLSYLPIYRLENLKNLDLNNNFLDWSIFSNQNETKQFLRNHQFLSTVKLVNTSLRDIKCLGLSNLVGLKILDLSNN